MGQLDRTKINIGGGSGGTECKESCSIGLGHPVGQSERLSGRTSVLLAPNGRIRLITAATLRSHTSKDLAQMAKTHGVPGWHSMRKEQLVKALLKQARSKPRSGSRKRGSPKTLGKTALTKKTVARKLSRTGNNTSRSTATNKTTVSESRIARQIRQDRQQQESLKNLALINTLERGGNDPEQDRVIAIVRDAYWIQAYWEVSKSTVARAKVALVDRWHTARPVLRVLNVVNDGSTNSTENIIREIPVHGGVRNWFIDVPEPSMSYRIAIGYATDDGKFHLVAKSNCVTTPAPNTDSFDHNWADIADDFKKFYALSGNQMEFPVVGGVPDRNAVAHGRFRNVNKPIPHAAMNRDFTNDVLCRIGGTVIDHGFKTRNTGRAVCHRSTRATFARATVDLLTSQ